MSTAKYTPEQLDAVNAEGSFIIVSAAAGSGKTTVLIEKLIRLLSDCEKRLRADRLIVVTFTNDAAGQILRKLGERLGREISGCDSSAEGIEKKKWLLKQQSYLGAAKISTISAFCFDLLRTSAAKLDISSDFRIIDEGEGTVMLLEAVEKTADEWFEDENRAGDISEIFDYFGFYLKNTPNRQDKYSELLAFRNFLLSVPFYRELFIGKYLKEYHKGFEDGFDPFDTIYGKEYSDRLFGIIRNSSFADSVKYIYTAWQSIFSIDKETFLRSFTKKTPAKYYDSSADCIKRLGEYIFSDAEPKGCEGWDKLISAVNIRGEIFKSTIKRETKEKNIAAVFDAAGISEYDAARFVSEAENIAALAGELSGLSPCTAEELKSDYRKHYDRLKLISGFIEAVNERFDSMKAEKNGLVFADGELLALKLLGRLTDDGRIVKTETAERISQDYDLIMIDEFQDSNDIQDTIFRLLSRDGDSFTAGKNIFTVGDIKQSIYNFRLANPKIFHDYLVSSEPYTSERIEKPRKILLNRNFRSSEQVIDFVNLIFEKLMSEKCGGIDYDDTQKLIFGGEVWNDINAEKAAQAGSLETELLLTDKNNTPFSDTDVPDAASGEDADEKDSTDSIDSEDEIKADRLESETVAMKIRELLDTHPGLSARDICILCPANADAPFFQSALASAGIRSSLDNRSSYLGSREISLVINMLRILDDPHHNIAMAGCLMSPVFMFDADDMAVITLLRRKRSIYKALCELDAAEDIVGIAEKCGCGAEALGRAAEKTHAFFGLWNRLRRAAAVLGIEDTIRRIYKDTELIPLMSLYPDGDTRRANLLVLPEYAKMYEKNSSCGTGGIYGFIRYIDSMTPNRIDLAGASASSEADDAVAIKTIHKSKGLEYPIVFLCRCHKVNRGESAHMFYTVSDGAAFTERNGEADSSYLSLPAELIAAKKKDDLMSERMRLMYVAMTRAKLKLCISAVMTLSDKDADSVYRAGAVNTGCESIVTDCAPDEYITKYYTDNILPAVDGDRLIPERLLRMSGKGPMLNWVIAALSVTGKVPYLNFAGAAPSPNNAHIKVSVLRSDGRIYRTAADSDTSTEYKGSVVMPDTAIKNRLAVMKSYDTDERYRTDRARAVTAAKVTVTEMNAEANRLPEDAVKDKRLIGRILTAEELTSDRTMLTSAEKGTALHAFMQYADLAALENGTEDDIAEEAHRISLEGLMDESMAGYIASDRRIKRRIRAFFDSMLWKEIYKPNYGNIQREQMFMAKIADIKGDGVLDSRLGKYCDETFGDTFVQGIADCVIRIGDGFVLVDYKTNEGKSAEQLRDMYAVQLLLYRRVFERIYELEPGSGHAFIYSFGTDSSECCIEVR